MPTLTRTKKKPPVIPPITNAKAPVAVAYLTAAGKVFESRGTVKKVVVPAGSELALSHDGKKVAVHTRGFQRQFDRNHRAI